MRRGENRQEFRAACFPRTAALAEKSESAGALRSRSFQPGPLSAGGETPPPATGSHGDVTAGLLLLCSDSFTGTSKMPMKAPFGRPSLLVNGPEPEAGSHVPLASWWAERAAGRVVDGTGRSLEPSVGQAARLARARVLRSSGLIHGCPQTRAESPVPPVAPLTGTEC